ncbi:unnamed protein product [Polarella glacialis]|uniref:Uncharacterized protein n=1 Tax=Polarella glacialis TaxID=89957 RepID=A0A813L281_POLGL|nr:unnamed protein product [Polarella glacialis]
MDNTTQIHGKVHPMLGVVTLGDCELLMLRRSKGPNQPLKVVLHTEKQRIGGNHQTPLQLLRLDDDLDPNFHEDAALDAIERGSGLHCMSTREGDVIIMGSDGVFDNLFVEEIVEICNQKLPPRASAGRDFEPADSNTFLEIAQCLVQKAHSKSDISGRCPPQSTPVGFGGKADDTSVLVAEVVEWTAAKREDWEQGQWQRSSWGQMFGCGHDGYSAAEATSDSDFEEDETSRAGILKTAEAFTAGVLINAGLVHLLADASKELNGRRRLHAEEEAEDGYPWAELWCGIGCLLTHGAELLAETLLRPSEDGSCPLGDEKGRREKAAACPVAPKVVGHPATDDDDRSVFSAASRPSTSSGGAKVAHDVILEELGLIGPSQGVRSKSRQPSPTSPSLAESSAPPPGLRAVVVGPLLMLSLSLHSLLEGLSLGAAKESRTRDLFMAILAHKGVAAFSVGVAWQPTCPSVWRYIVAMVWFAAVTPIGIFMGHAVEDSPSGAVLTALSAGTFLYVGLVEVNPGVRAPLLPGAGAVAQALACVAGFTAMGLLALWT